MKTPESQDDNSSAIWTNLPSIKFDFALEDQKLFDEDNKRHIANIEKNYLELKKRYAESIEIPPSGTHKYWITQRVKLYTTTSIMRLLYLTESFCECSKNFNLVSMAIHIKAMIEIPLHLGYLIWMLQANHDFEEIRKELDKIAHGNKGENGLTSKGKINNREFYLNADEMMKKLFPQDGFNVKVFETIYKEANATGHHNNEARELLSGIRNKSGQVWHAKDRKYLFSFITQKIFLFFLHCDTILWLSVVFCNAIDHYLEQLPDYLPTKVV